MARKILLADDSVTAQNMGRKILADAGYEVITVNNGSAALKKIAEVKPDLIVLDVYMPGYSGLEVCQRLKEVQETSRIPILLTVGKLEPFKPEEAKRVRAEGFIVKPFEASELLSALAKLEDKIVPRPEASKPGRFARANAALDEGRYDKTVAVEEDSGWKDRISFPSKKKKAEPEDDGNEAATFNPPKPVPVKDVSSSDLAHVVEPYQPTEAAETRVNLGALAPEGLPKDVTPEEIAALAAAAAQVKGKIAGGLVAEVETSSLAGVHQETRPEAEAEKHEASKTESELVAEVVKAEVLKAEVPKEDQPAETLAPAGQKPEEKIEAPVAVPSAEAATSLAAPSSSNGVAAISATEPASAVSAHAGSGNGSSAADERRAEEPVTMAAAAGAGFSGARWMAVPVALAAEEAAISLEHEMQKAYAAFAAADAPAAEFVASVPQIHTPAAEPPLPSPVEPVLAELVASVPETPAAEVAQAMSAVASAASDAVGAAAKELEAVASSFTTVQPPVAAEPPSAPALAEEPGAQPAFEASQPIEAKEEKSVEASSPDSGSLREAPEPVADWKREESKAEESRLEAGKSDEPKEESKQEESRQEEPQHSEFAAAAASSDQASSEQLSSEHVSSEHVSSERVSASPVAASEVPADSAEPVEKPAARATDIGRKDSDIAATTAAAWASWRRVRESGDPKSAGESAPQDAARAVAAGAEKTPDGAPAANQEPGDIADIVDSVLADLRPKIVEEISRKMGKKK